VNDLKSWTPFTVHRLPNTFHPLTNQKMKTILIILFTIINVSTFAQTSIETSETHKTSMQIVDDDKIFSVKYVGERNGKPFNYNAKYDVSGMSNSQRDSIKTKVYKDLGIDKPVEPIPQRQAKIDNVTIDCKTCTGKMYVEIYGNDFTSTRKFNSKENSGFPYTLKLKAGEYFLKYSQNKALQIQKKFIVKEGENSVVDVK
jgi:hypothetical protein